MCERERDRGGNCTCHVVISFTSTSRERNNRCTRGMEPERLGWQERAGNPTWTSRRSAEKRIHWFSQHHVLPVEAACGVVRNHPRRRPFCPHFPRQWPSLIVERVRALSVRYNHLRHQKQLCHLPTEYSGISFNVIGDTDVYRKLWGYQQILSEI